MGDKNVLYDKSYAFSIRIVRLSQYLSKEKKEYISTPMYDSLLKDSKELVKLLVSITKTLKQNKGITK